MEGYLYSFFLFFFLMIFEQKTRVTRRLPIIKNDLNMWHTIDGKTSCTMQVRQYPPELPVVLRINTKPLNTKNTERDSTYVAHWTSLNMQSRKKMTADTCQKYPRRADTCAQEGKMQSEITRTGDMCQQHYGPLPPETIDITESTRNDMCQHYPLRAATIDITHWAHEILEEAFWPRGRWKIFICTLRNYASFMISHVLIDLRKCGLNDHWRSRRWLVTSVRKFPRKAAQDVQFSKKKLRKKRKKRPAIREEDDWASWLTKKRQNAQCRREDWPVPTEYRKTTPKKKMQSGTKIPAIPVTCVQ